MFNNLKEGIIVCEKQIKVAIMQYANELDSFKDYTFLTLSQLKNKLFFDYEKVSIYLLMKKYQLKPQVVLNYLNNMVYLNGLNIKHEKIELLKEMNEYLKVENALKNNQLFISRLMNKPITFIGYQPTKELTLIIDKLKQMTEVNWLNPFFNYYDLTVREFLNVYEEVRFVFAEVIKLIKSGVPLKKIKLCNVTKDYQFIVKRLGIASNIKIRGLSNNSILGTSFAKKLIYSLETADNFSEVIELLKDENKVLLNKVIAIINDYQLSHIKPSEFLPLMEYELTKIKFEEELYEEMLEVVDFDKSYFSDDTHVFFMGFNNLVPYIQKDEEYLEDALKEKIGLDTSLVKNTALKGSLIVRLRHYKNIQLSYSLKGTFNNFLPSNLINELAMKVIKPDNTFYQNEMEDNLLLAELLDNYYKFNEVSDLLTNNYYLDFRYNTFTHQYNKINPTIFAKYQTQPIKLSYSALKEYYSCSFAYYLNRVLRINKFTDNLETKLGIFAHEILNEIYQENFSFEAVKRDKMTACLDKKEEFYYEVMAEVVKALIDFNNEQEEHSKLNDVLCEKKIDILYDDGKLIFTGIIDKLKYSHVDERLVVAIIDYKTGQDKITLKNINDGLNLQLPVYLYLLKKSDLFKDPIVTGFYLQKINPAIFRRDQKATSSEQLTSSFRLEGYSLNDHKYLSYLHENYKMNNYIQTLRINKDNSFGKSSKVISQEQEDLLVDRVEELILKAYENIKSAEFAINPKRVEGKVHSCTYCSFSDICFVEYNDFIDLTENDFLDGEENVD